MNCTLGHLLLPKFYFGLGYIWCFHFGPGYVTFYRTLNHSRVPYLWPTLLHPSILYSDHPTPWFSFLIFFSHQNNVRWEKSFDCELDFVRSSSGTDPRGGMWLLRLIHGSISMEKKISTLIFFLTLFSPTKIMWAEKNHMIVISSYATAAATSCPVAWLREFERWNRFERRNPSYVLARVHPWQHLNGEKKPEEEKWRRRPGQFETFVKSHSPKWKDLSTPNPQWNLNKNY